MSFPYPYPLGLPKGTVRATITLAFTIDLIFLTLNSETTANLVSPLVLVALTFYFGGRMRINPSIIVPKAPAAERAWGLPAGTIRSLLIFLFGAFTVYLIYERRTLPSYILDIFNIIFGYLIGLIFLKIKTWYRRRKNSEITTSHIGPLDHLVSLLALSISGTTIYILTATPTVSYILLVANIASITLGFYFGGRST